MKNLLPCSVQQSKQLTNAEKLFFTSPPFTNSFLCSAPAWNRKCTPILWELTVVLKSQTKRKVRYCILKTKMPQSEDFSCKRFKSSSNHRENNTEQLNHHTVWQHLLWVMFWFAPNFIQTDTQKDLFLPGIFISIHTSDALGYTGLAVTFKQKHFFLPQFCVEKLALLVHS